MTTFPTNDNARRQPGEGAKQATEHRKYSLKSTATEAKRDRIIDALPSSSQKNYQLRRMGAYQAPARTIELRRMGYDIETELVTLYDRDGYMHLRCAGYNLRAEPLE